MAAERGNESRRRVALAALALVFVAAALSFAWPLLRTLGDPDEVRRLVEAAGVWGPLVFIGVQIAQVVIAPIPGQATVLLGGYLFGPWLGLAYTLIGSTTASALIFALTRRFGRPFVERFIAEKTLARFDEMAEDKGALAFFLVFLLPGLPDDAVSFIAGLSTVPVRTLIVVSVVGRLPGYVVLAFAGYDLTSGRVAPVVAVLVAMALVAVVGYWKQAWLREFVASDDRRPLLAEAWSASWRTLSVVTIIAATAAVLITMGIG